MSSRDRALCVGLVLASLAAGGALLVTTDPAEAATTTYTGPSFSSDVSAVPASDGLSTPVVATGKIVNDEGAPVQGVPVALSVWPSAEVIESMVEGDSFTMQPLARATTTSTGAYTLRVPSNVSVNSFVSPSTGFADFEIRTPDGVRSVPYSFSAAPSQGSSGLSLAPAEYDGSSSATPEVANFVYSETTVGHMSDIGMADEPTGGVVDVDPTSEPTLVEDPTPTPTVTKDPCDGVNGCAPEPMSCDVQFQKELGRQAVLLAGLYSNSASAKVDFEWETGANSGLGIGFSATGTYGSFNVSGEASRETKAGYSYQAKYGEGSWHYYSEWVYGKFKKMCYTHDGTFLYDEYYVRPTKSVGGGWSKKFASSKAPGATYCATVEPGGTIWRSSSKAVTWRTGVKLENVIGMDLTAHTGYSSDSKVMLHNRSPYTRKYVCGTHDYPGGDRPRRLVFKYRL